MNDDRSITLRSDGARHELLLDGEPLRGVRAVTVKAEVGNYVEVEVDLLVRHDFSAEVVAGQHHVSIPTRTHETLVRLGWTPPSEGA